MIKNKLKKINIKKRKKKKIFSITPQKKKYEKNKIKKKKKNIKKKKKCINKKVYTT